MCRWQTPIRAPQDSIDIARRCTAVERRLLVPRYRQAVRKASIDAQSASDARANANASTHARITTTTAAAAARGGDHHHQALCVRDGAAVKVSVQSRFDARSCPLCREHPCHPHGAPGSDDALQAGAPSMPACYTTRSISPNYPAAFHPFHCCCALPLAFPSSSPFRACEWRRPLA